MASTTTVGAHTWEECRNNVVNTWELESCSVDDDDEEPVELGKGNLGLFEDSLAHEAWPRATSALNSGVTINASNSFCNTALAGIRAS
jgi:hypothetical protein